MIRLLNQSLSFSIVTIQMHLWYVPLAKPFRVCACLCALDKAKSMIRLETKAWREHHACVWRTGMTNRLIHSGGELKLNSSWKGDQSYFNHAGLHFWLTKIRRPWTGWKLLTVLNFYSRLFPVWLISAQHTHTHVCLHEMAVIYLPVSLVPWNEMNLTFSQLKIAEFMNKVSWTVWNKGLFFG